MLPTLEPPPADDRVERCRAFSPGQRVLRSAHCLRDDLGTLGLIEAVGIGEPVHSVSDLTDRGGAKLNWSILRSLQWHPPVQSIDAVGDPGRGLDQVEVDEGEQKSEALGTVLSRYRTQKRD